MVQTFILYVNSMPDSLSAQSILSLISEQRADRIRRLKKESSRKESLGAGLLLRYILMKRGLLMSDVYLDRNGKPMIDGLYFNISHSEDIVVCSVSDEGQVGVDVQILKSVTENISNKYFSPAERDYLDSLSSMDKNPEFIRMWTFKESYLKMTGEGLTVPLNSFDVITIKPCSIIRNNEKINCFFREYDLPNHKLTVCSEDHVFSDRVTEISFDDLVRYINTENL